MKRSRYIRAVVAVSAIAGLFVSANAAELYRWIDERGVTNYSNEPPPKGASAKDVRTVEDRLSVYTPEKSAPVASPPAQQTRSASVTREPEPEPRASAAARSAAPAYDPCITSANEIVCYGPAPYDASPVFSGRYRRPRLVQPELRPGAIAGNVTGSGGYIAGQSANAPPAVSPRARSARPQQPSGSFTLRDRDREGRR
jgi:hypothetical protein